MHSSTDTNADDINKLAELDKKRKDLTEAIINIRNRYLRIDDQFEYELEKMRERTMRGIDLCGCLKT
jgi:hypothetical protein